MWPSGKKQKFVVWNWKPPDPEWLPVLQEQEYRAKVGPREPWKCSLKLPSRHSLTYMSRKTWIKKKSMERFPGEEPVHHWFCDWGSPELTIFCHTVLSWGSSTDPVRYTSKFVERIPVKFGVSEKRVEVLDTRRCVLNPSVFSTLFLSPWLPLTPDI